MHKGASSPPSAPDFTPSIRDVLTLSPEELLDQIELHLEAFMTKRMQQVLVFYRETVFEKASVRLCQKMLQHPDCLGVLKDSLHTRIHQLRLSEVLDLNPKTHPEVFEALRLAPDAVVRGYALKHSAVSYPDIKNAMNSGQEAVVRQLLQNTQHPLPVCQLTHHQRYPSIREAYWEEAISNQNPCKWVALQKRHRRHMEVN